MIIKSNLPMVSVILLHWKDYDDTKNCIDSLSKINYSNFEIIVVDNFSNDGSVEKLQSDNPNVIFIYNENNLGFSKGVNQGIKYAYEKGSDYFLILNNDMLVEENFLINAINEIPKLNNIGAITGKIMFQDKPNVFWQAGGYIDKIRFQGIPRGKDLIDIGQFDKICKTGWASGAMSLLPRKTIELVGLFPEEYFFGQEEWDYSIAILKSKLNIYYLPNFKAYHKAGGSYKPGHPILNIYGGYVNKMICAEKYLPKYLWFMWKYIFYFYLKLYFPFIAKKSCNNQEDINIYKKAALQAFEDKRYLTKVELNDLLVAYKKIGTTDTWGKSWES